MRVMQGRIVDYGCLSCSVHVGPYIYVRRAYMNFKFRLSKMYEASTLETNKAKDMRKRKSG